MGHRLSTIVKGCVVIGLGAAAAIGQAVSNESSCVPPSPTIFQTISKAEVEMLIRDVPAQVIDGFRKDPELKKGQLENLRELLALASQAVRDGDAAVSFNCIELESVRDEITAVTYDKHINTGKGPMPPFGFIPVQRVSAFWGKGGAGSAPKALAAARERAFERFLNAKIAVLAAGDPAMKDRAITDEEREQARDFFAKTQIYAEEFAQKSSLLPKPLKDKVALQIKLQQAQFLAREYSSKLAERANATDEEIAEYIRVRPELDTKAKRSKAEQILSRAKNNEDFAKLANEFTEDPGNKGSDGELHGGIYRDVRKGLMVAPFEAAALAVEAGQVYPNVVESDFGYHIVKLERKGDMSGPAPTGTYDVRHILISTSVPDVSNPAGRDVPLKQYVRSKVEDEKQKALINALVAANKISVPADFALPAPVAKVVAKKSGSRPVKRPVTKRK